MMAKAKAARQPIMKGQRVDKRSKASRPWEDGEDRVQVVVQSEAGLIMDLREWLVGRMIGA